MIHAILELIRDAVVLAFWAGSVLFVVAAVLSVQNGIIQ